MRLHRRALLVLPMLVFAASVSAKVKTGTYIGDGAASRSITGLGFAPVVVIIKGNDTDAADDLTSAVLRSATMPAGMSKPLKGDQGLSGNMILSLDPDGFTVGSNRRVNANTVAFHYVAFDASPNLSLGTYVGNGGSLSVSTVGFNPDYVILMEDGASRAMHQSYHWNQSFSFNSENSFAGTVTAFNPNGFSLGNNSHVNENGRTYHYVAWQEAQGQMRTSWYFGNGVDNRSIVSGLRPEYVIVRDMGGNDEAYQRFSSMAGDASVNFKNSVQTNRIKALQTNGFQVGTANQVNNGSSYYFYVAFGNDPAPGLSATESASTLTVTVPDYFDLTFSTDAGGGVEQFHDLSSGPNSSLDLAGGVSVFKSLFFDTMAFGGNWYNTGQNDVEPEIELLEATPTRVKVRQEAFYQREGGSSLIAGVKGLGDYTIYPAGRMALRWDRVTTKSLANQAAQMGLSVHKRNSQYLSNWSAWSETASLPPGGPGTDLFLLAGTNDLTYGTYTDFLQILHRRWTAADSTQWFENTPTGNEWGVAIWNEANGQTLPALERWDSMIHFKPTDFVDRTDPHVLGRRDDYRSPDPFTFVVGSGWNENAADADFFNESEGAYTLNFNPAAGLQFDVNGSVVRRRKPFFKIRQWRSLLKPMVVSLEGTALVADFDYRSDVKPLARGHFAAELLWHSTLDSAAEVTNPDVGSPGTVNGGVAFTASRYGNGASLSSSSANVSFPGAGNLRVDRGAVELWYQPSYYHADGTARRIWSYFVDAANQFHLTKEASNNLAFEILRGGVSTKVSVTPFNYGWLDFEWVHLRVTWDAAAPVADQARIFVNRVEPPHTNPSNSYNAALMPTNGTVFIGGSGALSTDGIVDEFHVYGAPTADLAHGGLASNTSEYLGTPSRDFQFPLTVVDSLDRGAYLYFGADARFRGLNVSLANPGTGTLDLAWEYWNGSRWADLESGTGFTDETNHLTRNGALFWSLDPPGWSELSVDGDTDLFYVRAHLRSGAYASFPREKEIRTDILLFQYQKDIAAAAQTFSFDVPPAYDVSLSSASNQTFAVGAATPVSPVAFTITDLLGGSITAANDIRIRIPAGFPLRWDSSVASASLAGSAAPKVNPTILAYEDLDKTLVLNVVTSFAPGDQLIVSGLGLEGFLHPAAADNLELEVDGDGSISAFDDKTITIVATATPNLSSDDHQLFVVGQAATLAEKLYVTEAIGGGVLTGTNDFEIVIPAGFPMEWNTLVGSVVLSGPGASRLSTAVTYPTPQRARFNVTSNFAPGEHVIIEGLQFRTFSAAAPFNNLRLHAPTGTGVDSDDKTIQIVAALDAPFFTATATDFQVRLEWVNPSLGACLNIHIVRKEGSFPANPADGFLVLSPPLACVPGKGELFDDVAGLSNDTTYYYTLFVEHSTLQFTPGKQVKARPFDTSGRVKWAYSTGATAMAPPGLRFYGGNVFVYAVSNDNVLHAVDGGITGGSWPAGWTPYSVGAPVQARPPVLGFTVGGAAQGVALLGAQSGSVHAVNAANGQPEWVEPIASMVQAAPAGNFRAFDPSALDLVLVGTRNSSTANALIALDIGSGAAQWGFVNSVPQNGDGLDIGIISSSASVHYATKRVFFASRTRSGGSPDTVWAVDFAASPPQLLWSKSIGNIDGSPVLFSGVLYVGTNAGEVVALDAATGNVNWSLPLGDGAVKGFVFPSRTGDLFVSTSSKIWSVSAGGAVNPGWPVTAASVPSPSTPIVLPGGGDVLAGSSDGRLHQLDRVLPLPTANVVLGDGSAAVGSPSVDLLNSMVYVGTDQGVIYGVLLPLP